MVLAVASPLGVPEPGLRATGSISLRNNVSERRIPSERRLLAGGGAIKSRHGLPCIHSKRASSGKRGGAVNSLTRQSRRVVCREGEPCKTLAGQRLYRISKASCGVRERVWRVVVLGLDASGTNDELVAEAWPPTLEDA